MEASKEVVLTAYSYFGGRCEVKFTESGYEVLCDTRKCKDGYLHVSDGAPEAVTPAVAEQLIKYFYNHKAELPGLGATPQSKYLAGYTLAQREAIGNGGKRAYYNRI